MWLNSRVVVVVPALDEAPRIARMLRKVPSWVDHVLVVDDASTDGTARVAWDLGDSRVAVVRHARNRGVGAAIATGYRLALTMHGGPHDAFVVMAGDDQMDPLDLPSLVMPIAQDQADYVKGDRFRGPAVAQTMPAARLLGGRVFSWATSHAIGLSTSDSQCGYTAIARQACAKLDLAGLWPGYGYPNDLLSQLAIRGLRIAETPVRPVYGDEVSRLKLRHVPAVAGLVVRAWLRRVAAPRGGTLRGFRSTESTFENGRDVGQRVIEVE
jgi:glycosyltransferase involved in cell wall biosynthesis